MDSNFKYMIVCLAGPAIDKMDSFWSNKLQYRDFNGAWTLRKRDAATFTATEAEEEMNKVSTQTNSDYFVYLVRLPKGVPYLRMLGEGDEHRPEKQAAEKLRAIEL
jgi:hypothetical protein